MPRRERGFTIVELLIVIVITGILSGSLLLVFGSANNRSTETRVISDLMTLKRASVIFF
ncbi:MAG: prepilin-type N-terminal cleavage/methylation domain-containing protein [Thermovirgaceae bacterium]|nr:prepilin-type N-terminal cleavage/methylation domain-containing protein [Thermovirgaceae bacterium]